MARTERRTRVLTLPTTAEGSMASVFVCATFAVHVFCFLRQVIQFQAVVVTSSNGMQLYLYCKTKGTKPR
jgi:hypothetical protein